LSGINSRSALKKGCDMLRYFVIFGDSGDLHPDICYPLSRNSGSLRSLK
jgi:hypothetical protein